MVGAASALPAASSRCSSSALRGHSSREPSQPKTANPSLTRSTQAAIRCRTPSANVRSTGIGSRLIDAVVDQSRALGHTTLLLDTNGVLTEALGLYAKHGFELIERYNDNPDATHFFAKTL
jgi:N-acetylglutamate synthase-like GNAT family acetyltransferase